MYGAPCGAPLGARLQDTRYPAGRQPKEYRGLPKNLLCLIFTDGTVGDKRGAKFAKK